MSEGSPGSYQICKICFWEDDAVQLLYLRRNGANPLSLIQAQENFVLFGASEERMLKHTRAPLPGDKRDSTWRPVDPARDRLESSGLHKTYMQILSENVREPEELYYWLKESS
ncbi:MAG: hydrolase [Chloroflexi bacterium]|nr:hydrolase [Chloroflexota bacterium]OJV99143.1 MAG: hypothetical protein BGO39_16950 [Chloroflexi bacterium 54-19]